MMDSGAKCDLSAVPNMRRYAVPGTYQSCGGQIGGQGKGQSTGERSVSQHSRYITACDPWTKRFGIDPAGAGMEGGKVYHYQDLHRDCSSGGG